MVAYEISGTTGDRHSMSTRYAQIIFLRDFLRKLLPGNILFCEAELFSDKCVFVLKIALLNNLYKNIRLKMYLKYIEILFIVLS